MSSLQAAKDRIIISGILTANVNLIFPAWIKSWVVHNNCTGNFTITCRTASGSGVVVIPGLVSRIFCDGVNITDETLNPNNDMVGAITGFAMISAPTGWLIADGSAVSRTTYARLFSRIGTTWGSGDGVNTFNLPDARGVFIRGLDNGKGYDSGRDIGTYQADAVQAHNHYLPTSSGTPASTYGINDNAFIASEVNYNPAPGVITTTYPNSQYSIGSQVGSVGNFAPETRVKNISVLNCIKY